MLLLRKSFTLSRLSTFTFMLWRVSDQQKELLRLANKTANEALEETRTANFAKRPRLEINMLDSAPHAREQPAAPVM